MRKTAASMWIWDILGGCRTMNCSTTSRTGRPASGCWWISPGPVSRQAQRGEHGLRSDGLLTGDEPGVGVGHEGHTDVPQVDTPAIQPNNNVGASPRPAPARPNHLTTRRFTPQDEHGSSCVPNRADGLLSGRTLNR